MAQSVWNPGGITYNVPRTGGGVADLVLPQGDQFTDIRYLNTPTMASYLTAYAGGYQAAPTEKPVDPVYTKAVETVGVLQHMDRVHDLFLHAKRGILDLREGLRIKPVGAEQSLRDRIEAFLVKYARSDERQELLAAFYDDEFKQFSIPDGGNIVGPGEKPGGAGADDPAENDHTALFRTGKVMVDDIRVMETLRHALTVLRRRRQLELARRQEELTALEEEIPPARKELDVLERARIEAFGDQALAQRLVAEDWAAVEQQWAERRRILEEHRGLYYVRVRESPVSMVLPDPLDLHYADADDVVPGCPDEPGELPEALTPFLEAVYDIPIGDWAALRELHFLLPSRSRVELLVAQRRDKLVRRQTQSGGAQGAAVVQRLAPLRQQNLALTSTILQRPFVATAALSVLHKQSRDLLSLDDLLSGPPHRLRGPAQTLHQRLGSAAACLITRVQAIAPSIRLDWAEETEHDRLAVETPERWPGLDKAEAADFNGVRTLVELLRWWFRQLHREASGASRTALRNYVRACLLLAASDDPDQVLRGNVSGLPGRFRVGELLRLNLNREALPGTLLQLMNTDQQVVGTLRVDDHDELGAVAVLAQVLDPTVTVTTGFQVSGFVSAGRSAR